MKKFFCTVLFTVMMCGIMSAAGCKAETRKKTLKMATEATFPPYEYFEKGKIVGIDADIVGEIAKNLGYELQIMDMKFDSVILAVQTGKCDIAASGITVTEERKKKINFTLPYVTAAQVIIVPAKSKIKNVQDLNNKKIRIGVQSGTTGDIYVSKNLHEPLRFDNAALAVAALISGKLEAVICDSEPAKVHIAKHPELVILPTALTYEEYAFALAKKDVDLLKKFNEELIKMRKSGRLQAILDHYLNPKKK